MIRRLLASIGISSIIIIVTMIGQIISVPVLLSHWNAEVYGEWLSLTNLVASLSILNLGIQSYVCNLLIAHFVRGELEEGFRKLHSAILLYSILGFIAIAILAIIILWPGLLGILHVTAIPPYQAKIILLVQGLLAIYAIWGGLFLSLFQVSKQMPRQLAYGLMERIVYIFIPLIIALLGGMPYKATIGLGTILFGLACIEIWDVQKRSPFKIGIARASWNTARSLVRPSFTFFAVALSTTILSSGVVVLLANRLGAISVTLFTTTLALSNLIRTIINQGMNVLWPEITSAGASFDDPIRLARWHRLVLKLASYFALVCSIGLILIGPYVLQIWTQGSIRVDHLLNSLLAILLAVQSPAIVSGAFGLALNHQGDQFKIQLIMGIIAITSGFILTSYLGVSGMALGLIIGQLITLQMLMKKACSWTNDKWKDLRSSVFLRGLPVWLIAAFFCFIGWLAPGGLINKTIILIITIFFTSYLSWKFWLNQEERNILFRRFIFLITEPIFNKVRTNGNA